MAAWVSESVQVELMSDNRVAALHGQLWHTAASEVKWLVDLRESTWEAIGAASGMDAMDLRDKAIRAAHISFHFLWRRVLEPSADLPWSLARGDVEANLQELADGDCPDEPFSKHIWQLYHGNYHRVHLLDTIKLLGEVGWTSMVCEQQHGSLAQLRRRHPEYSMHTLICRGLMHHTVRVLETASPAERTLALLIKKMINVAGKVPSRAGPINMVVKQ